MSDGAIKMLIKEQTEIRSVIHEIECWIAERRGACDYYLNKESQKLYGFDKRKISKAKVEEVMLSELSDFIRQQKKKI